MTIYDTVLLVFNLYILLCKLSLGMGVAKYGEYNENTQCEIFPNVRVKNVHNPKKPLDTIKVLNEGQHPYPMKVKLNRGMERFSYGMFPYYFIIYALPFF